MDCDNDVYILFEIERLTIVPHTQIGWDSADEKFTAGAETF